MGAFLGSPEVSWAVLVRLERIWGVPWVRPGVPESVSKASWSYFGTSWKDLEEVWGSLGGFLEAFWEYFWKIFYHLGQNAEIAKNLRKPMVFHCFLRFWEGSGTRKIFKNR